MLRKALKILKWILISVILLIVALWFILKIPSVQNWLGQKVVKRLAKELNANVTVDRVRFALFNKLEIEGLLIQDQRNDTLLYAGKASVRITDWFFLKNTASLKYVGLDDAVVKLQRSDSVWNYQFIADRFSGGSGGGGGKSSLQLNLKQVVLNRLVFIQNDGWEGQNTLARLQKAELDADDVDFSKKIVNVNSFILTGPEYYMNSFKGRNPAVKDTLAAVEEDSLAAAPPGGLQWNKDGWHVMIKELVLKDGRFGNEKATDRPAYNYFDGQHLLFTGINATFTNLQWQADTISTGLDIVAKERSGLDITAFKSLVRFYPHTMEFDTLLLTTPNSRISDYLAFSFKNFSRDISDFIHRVRLSGRFNNTVVSSKDLALFSPQLASLNRDIVLNGAIRGTVDNMTGTSLSIQAGATSLSGNLVVTGLSNSSEAFIDLNNALLKTSYNELLVFVPSLRKVKGAQLQHLGNIQYKGNFTGFVKDFVTYGTLNTGLGEVVMDLNLKLNPGKDPVYAGKLHTASFQLGRLLGNNKLGNIGFNGKVSGRGFDINTLKADIDGTVTSFRYDRYTYRNISAKGRLENKTFNGTIVAADPHLQAKVSGLVKLGGRPAFDLTADIKKADFKELQFTKEDYSLSGLVKLDFSGSSLEDLSGRAAFTNARVMKDGSLLPIDSVTATAEYVDGVRQVTVNSNEFNALVKGHFSFKDISRAFQFFGNRYYPTLVAAPPAFRNNQDFSFEVHTRNVDALLGLLTPKLRGFNASDISGHIDADSQTTSFKANIPYFAFNTYEVHELVLDGKGTLENLTINGQVNEIKLSDSVSFFNTELSMVTTNGESQFTLKGNSNTTLNKLDISGALTAYNDGVSILFNPSSFTINNKDWKLERNGELILRKNVISAQDLRFIQGDQEIALRSEVAGEDNSYNLVADLKNINIGDFTPLFIKSNKFQGRLSGTVTVRDPLGGKPEIVADSYIDHFWLDNDSIGRVAVNGNFNTAKSLLTYNLVSANKNYDFSAGGTIRLKDSLNGGVSFNNKVKLNGANVALAKRFLSTIFTDISGNAVGELEINGNANKPYITGFAEVTDSMHITIGFTNVKYTIPKARIDFNAGIIDFGNTTLHDTLGHVGYIGNGRIMHDGFFKNMSFDIEMRTDNMLLLNTNKAINKTFYGYAIGDARLKLKGATSNMQMDIDVNNPTEADISLVTNAQGRTLGKADFVEFRTLGREMQALTLGPASNLTVHINVNANPKMKVRVVLDELAGDNIEAVGSGNIDFTFRSGGDMSLVGTYTVQSGKYDFSLQSWLRKPFIIKGGSTITWQGNPLEAAINIDAEYIAKDVNLTDFRKDLMSLDNSGSPNSDLAVTAELRGRLAKPDINFRIGYPADAKSTPSQLLQNVLKLLESDKNEINRQVAFLVLFNRLMSYDAAQSSGSTVNLNTGVNTISGFIAAEATNYLNRLLEKIFGNGKLKANIDFNIYTPGGLSATQDVGTSDSRVTTNIKFSRSWFDERLTIYFTSNLDFGLGANQAGQVNFALLPNIQVEYKIRPNGQVVATVFHRQVLDILQADAERKRLSTGAGIIWRKDAETLGELFGARKKTKPSDSLRKQKPLLFDTIPPPRNVPDSLKPKVTPPVDSLRKTE